MYNFENTAIAPAPQFLIEACLGKPKTQPNLSSLSGQLFKEGRRNTDMTSLAGLLRRKGADQEQLEALLTEFNQSLPSPLDQSEINRISQSVARYDVTPDGFTHDSFAKLLAKKFEGKVLYCVGRGFYHYDGKQWKHDPEGLIVLGIARTLSDEICADIEALKSQCDEAAYTKLKKAGSKTKSADFLSKSIKLVKTDQEVKVTYDQFDQHKHLINCLNGTYDLQSNQLKPHEPKDRLTYLLDVEYDSAASCPNFDSFLKDILSAEQIPFILRVLGYALTGTGREQMFFIFHGRGKNGKSTLLQIISSVMGDLLINIQAESLNGKMDGQIRNDLARLPGKRILVTNETRAGSILDAPLMKQITGLDTLTVRFLRQEYFEFQPVCVPIIVTNHLPVIDGSDHAMERRVCLISFDQVIQKPDKDLYHKLVAEKSGILNLILEGLADYKAGLQPPPSVQQRTKAFVERSNLMKGFFLDRLERTPGERLGAGELYQTYQSWSWESGYKPMSTNQFKEAFERETGMEQGRDSQGRFWSGLRLKKLI